LDAESVLVFPGRSAFFECREGVNEFVEFPFPKSELREKDDQHFFVTGCLATVGSGEKIKNATKVLGSLLEVNGRSSILVHGQTSTVEKGA
jgi:hypothetical protein